MIGRAQWAPLLPSTHPRGRKNLVLPRLEPRLLGCQREATARRRLVDPRRESNTKGSNPVNRRLNPNNRLPVSLSNINLTQAIDLHRTLARQSIPAAGQIQIQTYLRIGWRARRHLRHLHLLDWRRAHRRGVDSRSLLRLYVVSIHPSVENYFSPPRGSVALVYRRTKLGQLSSLDPTPGLESRGVRILCWVPGEYPHLRIM